MLGGHTRHRSHGEQSMRKFVSGTSSPLSLEWGISVNPCVHASIHPCKHLSVCPSVNPPTGDSFLWSSHFAAFNTMFWRKEQVSLSWKSPTFWREACLLSYSELSRVPFQELGMLLREIRVDWATSLSCQRCARTRRSKRACDLCI